MKDLLRHGDPTFYDKEPILLRTGVEIPRYTDEAQLEARLKVLTEDRLLHWVTAIAALAGFAAVTAIGTIGVRGDWPGLAAFAVLTVVGPRALPWTPYREKRSTLLQMLTGMQTRRVVLILAVAALFEHALLITLVPTVIVGGLTAVSGFMISRAWRRSALVVTPAACAVLLFASAYTLAFDWPALALHIPGEIAAIAIAYIGVCIIAGRVRRSDVLARPEGLLSLPQSIVPLLDRSYHHAIICWRV